MLDRKGAEKIQKYKKVQKPTNKLGNKPKQLIRQNR